MLKVILGVKLSRAAAYWLLILCAGCTGCSQHDFEKVVFGDDGIKPRRAYRPDRILAFGDSVTHDPTGFPLYLSNMLNLPLANAAFGGSTISDDQQIGRILKSRRRTDLVIFLAGYNDMRAGRPTAEFLEYLKKALDHWNKLEVNVVVGTTQRMCKGCYVLQGSQTYNKGSDGLVMKYREGIIKLASKYPNVFIADVTLSFNPVQGDNISDLVHPNTIGASEIAKIFFNSIRFFNLVN